MGTTTKTLLAAGVIGTIGLCLFGLGEDPTPAAEEVAMTADADAADVTTGTEVAGRDAQAVREAVLSPEAIPSWLEHPFTHELEVRVLDRFGLPVVGHTLELGPTNCSLNRASIQTDPDGRAAVAWPARTQSGEVCVRDEAGALHRVTVQHGATAKLTLSGKGGETIQALFESNGTLTIGRLRSFNFRISRRPRAPAMQLGMHPHALFQQAAADRGSAPGTITLLGAEATTRSSRVRFVDVARIEGNVLLPQSQNQQNASISGTVFGADGKPAAKVRVTVLGGNGRAVSRGQTDDDGLFLIEGLAAARFTVRAGGCRQGLGTCDAVTTTGTTPVTVHLGHGATIRGRAETARGEPLAKARITWRAADGSWCDETAAGPDGSFLLANLPVVAGTVMAWIEGRPFPVAVAEDVLCNTPDLLLRDDCPTGRLLVEPALDEQLGKPAKIRCWSEDTGIGAVMPEPEKGEPWALSHLPAGWYRVELFHPSTGPVDAGRHWVDGRSDCNLGRVVMPKPAVVRFAIEDPNGAGRKFEIYRVRPDLDVRVALTQAAPDRDSLLEPGDYVVFWVDGDGKVRFERFAAEPGKELTVRIPI